jgi:methylenetetrahydrofolate--tRNA-(uracil-5-)-methyltransferase
MAERSKDTLAWAPEACYCRSETGKRPPSYVGQEDRFETMFNLVISNPAKQEEQKRLVRMIPGLEKAEFARLGSIHRNTFIDSPRLLKGSLQLKDDPRLFFAGQITGVEGYMDLRR